MNHILVLNSGSSSLKFALYRQDGDMTLQALARGQVSDLGDSNAQLRLIDAKGARHGQELGACDHPAALDAALDALHRHVPTQKLGAVGHRIVHGGERFNAPTLLDECSIAQLHKLVPLAPLHQPHNLAAVEAVRAQLPEIPQVACFDTAFHHDQPDVARNFGLPRRLTEQGLRRYGFHGLSYQYVAQILPSVCGSECAQGAVVVAHLGAGASLCALRQGKSVATTMGFSALDGLLMSTRCGQLDPGVLLYLMDEHAMNARALEHLLYHESGLLGVSGISADMRTLLAESSASAREAVELYCYRAAREIGSMMVAAGGLDALVFTAGIGERAPQVRARIVQHLAWTGARLDDRANADNRARIDAPDSAMPICVVATDEECVIAEGTLNTIQA